jgi:hypothetical protein
MPSQKVLHIDESELGGLARRLVRSIREPRCCHEIAEKCRVFFDDAFKLLDRRAANQIFWAVALALDDY